MVSKKTWEEFRRTGLLLIINQLLHVFGWALVYSYTEDNKLDSVYPARVKFRGFDNAETDKSYKQVTDYLANNIQQLKDEVQ